MNERRKPGTPDFHERCIPSDLKAEMGMLGSLLLMADRQDAIDTVLAIACPEDCFDDANAKILAAIASHHSSGRRMDPLLVSRKLMEAGEWDLIGGRDYFGRVIASVVNYAHAVYYAEIVARKALARRLIARCTDLLKDAYDAHDPADVVRSMQSACYELTQRSGRSFAKPRLIADVAAEVLRTFESPESSVGAVRAWWGLYVADDCLGPFLGGEVVIAAARPGAGKTAFACHLLHNAAKHEQPCLLISLEMTDREIAGRDLARVADVDGRRIRSGKMDAEDVLAMRLALTKMAGLPVWLWSPYTATLAEIRGMVQRMIADHNIQLVAIDYLSLIEPAREWRDLKRYEQVCEISRGLHRLAREVNLPFVVLQQLSRDADGQEPSLRHLAESGSIERDADIVVFLNGGPGAVRRIGPHKTKPVPHNERDLIVSKFRAGPAGKMTIGWDGSRTRFFDLEGPPEVAASTEPTEQQGVIF